MKNLSMTQVIIEALEEKRERIKQPEAVTDLRLRKQDKSRETPFTVFKKHDAV